MNLKWCGKKGPRYNWNYYCNSLLEVLGRTMKIAVTIVGVLAEIRLLYLSDIIQVTRFAAWNNVFVDFELHGYITRTIGRGGLWRTLLFVTWSNIVSDTPLMLALLVWCYRVRSSNVMAQKAILPTCLPPFPELFKMKIMGSLLHRKVIQGTL